MANIRNDHFMIGIKKLMIFDVAGNKYISPGPDRIIDQKTAATATNSDFLNLFTNDGCVFYASGTKNIFYPFQKINGIFRDFQFTGHSGSNIFHFV